MIGRSARRVLGLLALLCSLAGSAAGADAVLVLNAEGRQAITSTLGIFDDPEGRLDLAAVRAAAAGFAELDPGTRHLGFRPGTTWIRFVLHNPGLEAAERWLELGSPLVERADLHLVAAAGPPRHLRSGAAVPLAERPLAAGMVLFPVRLAGGETVEAYLALAGKTARQIDPTLWQPVAYAEARRLSATVKALAASAGILAIAYSLFAWRSRGQRTMLALALAQVASLVVAGILEGFFAGLLPASEAVWQSRLLWAAVFVAIACHAVFARDFIYLPRRFPGRARLVSGLAGLALALAGISLLVFIPKFYPLAGLTLVGVFSLAIARAALEDSPAGRIYFAAWGGFWVLVGLRMATALGVFPTVSGPVNQPVFGFAFAALVMAWGIHVDLGRQRKAGEDARRRLTLLQDTEQVRLQAAVETRTRQLHEALARAESANRAKSAFLSVVSHELRTPLHTILGYTQLLQRQLAGEARDKLAIVANNSEQLLRRINDVLDFSRGEAFSVEITLEPVVLADLVKELESSSQLLARRRGNRFEASLGADCPPAVEADEARLLQVLQNLIDNACKYTEGGVVRLTIAPDAGSDAVSPDGQWRRLVFAVEDSGCGIAENDQSLIFEPFKRAGNRQHQPGVGLGLAIARQFARAMGGEIEVASAPGEGSTFRVVLPMRCAAVDQTMPAAAPEAAETVVEAAEAAAPRPIRLLVADDIPENRKLLEEACRRFGFDIITARDGAEALAACLGAAPPVAAALVDQFMPGQDGWDFLRAVRESPRGRDLPVILISAAAAKRPEGFPEGVDFDHVLLKPLRLDRLLAVLRETLGFDQVPSAPPPPAGDVPAGPPTPWPPPALLDELRSMHAQGQILAMQRWADRLAAAQPDYAPFCRRVVKLCQAVDLPGLKRLLDQAA